MSDILVTDILSIPELAFEKILSYLSYDEIATNRLVSRRFNNACSGMLTKGFIQLEKKHAHIYKFVKSLLPKRPSERRSNVLVSRYCEILQGMETRIRMLNVTFMRYIDQQLICFVPGKVLDEIKRLLKLIEMRFDPPANNNVLLEELRDLSSMAMEHFDEHILPHLEKREEGRLSLQYENSLPSTSKPSEEEKMHKELKKLYKRNRVFKSQLGYIIAKTRLLCDKWNRQNMRVKKQSSIIKEQNAKLLVQATRIENHEMTISEMKKRFEELQSSFVEVKLKWESESTQNISAHTSSPLKNPVPENRSSVTNNLTKLVQFESRCQKPNVLKKIGNRSVLENRSVFIKPRSQKLKVDELKRRRYKSMVDVDIWRRCCPTSRLSYSMWYRNYIKNKSTKLEMLKKDQNPNEPSCSQSISTDEVKNSKKAPGFVYKSVIKQRCSKVFPLTCLNLERKRKSYASADIPSKLSKIDSDNTFKALDLLNKYLPSLETNSSSAVVRKRTCSNISNPSPFNTGPMLYKRKRENDEET